MSFSRRKRFWVVLVGLLAAGLGIALRAPTPSPVNLQFLGPTWVDLVGERWTWEITNGLSRPIWWKIQYGETNSPGNLRLGQDGTNYQSGTADGMYRPIIEPPVSPHTSWKPHERRLKKGDKVWFVWTDQPRPPDIRPTAFNNWRYRFGAFAFRHGWKRTADYVWPKHLEPHVIELTVP